MNFRSKKHRIMKAGPYPESTMSGGQERLLGRYKSCMHKEHMKRSRSTIFCLGARKSCGDAALLALSPGYVLAIDVYEKQLLVADSAYELFRLRWQTSAIFTHASILTSRNASFFENSLNRTEYGWLKVFR